MALHRPGPLIVSVERRSTRLLLRHARVLDLDRGTRSEPMDVLVQGPRILDLDPGRQPAGTQELGCEGMTLMPGLIDCHVHILSFFGTGAEPFTPFTNIRQYRRNLRATLAAGVVCVRDLGDPFGIIKMVRRNIARGKLPGPRILSSGPILTCPGGYPEYLAPVNRALALVSGQLRVELGSPEEGVATVRRLARQGVDLIKLGYASTDARFDQGHPLPVLPDATIRAVCEAAHDLGLAVSMHHSDGDDLAACLRAPVDSLEHVIFDRDLEEDEARAFAASGIVNVPTMTVQENLVRFGDKRAFLHSPRAAELFEPVVLDRLRHIAACWGARAPAFNASVLGWTRNNRQRLAGIYRSLERMVQAGVPMCTGTDMGALVVFPGELPDELLRLEAAGLPRIEALRAATSHAARLLGLEDELGAVAPGMAADLLLVDGDPTADLHALQRPRLVGCGGRWYRPTHPQLPDLWGERGLILGR